MSPSRLLETVSLRRNAHWPHFAGIESGRRDVPTLSLPLPTAIFGVPIMAELSARRYPAGIPATEFPGAENVPLEYPGRRPGFSYCYVDGIVLPVSLRGGSPVVESGNSAPIDLDGFLRSRFGLAIQIGYNDVDGGRMDAKTRLSGG